MEKEIVTFDLGKFGDSERLEGELLLRAWRLHGLPDDFNADGVTLAFNMNSGSVFITNSDYQVAMLNGETLESFYFCPQCGHEGFKEDMPHNKDDKDCQEYLRDIGVSETEEA
jgi:hypothetical protein